MTDPDADPDADLAGRIEDFLRDALPGAEQVEVTGLRRAGGGSSKENWPFDAQWVIDGVPERRALLLRRDPEASVVETGRRAEFELLSALAATPVPTPRVLALDEDGSRLGRPSMLVERIEGRAHRAVLKAADPLGLGGERRLAVAEAIADTLGAVHRLDVAATGIDAALPGVGHDPAAHELDHWLGELDRVALEPQPALRFAARWLRDHRPPPPDRVTLVHGDFRPANVMVGPDGRIAALLDWEMAHLGDPYDDLGWYCTSIYRGEHLIAPAWDKDAFLRRYSAAAGTAVEDGPRLHFWEVMSVFRLAVIALTGIRIFCDGTSTRPAAPADRLVRRVLDDIGGAW